MGTITSHGVRPSINLNKVKSPVPAQPTETKGFAGKVAKHVVAEMRFVKRMMEPARGSSLPLLEVGKANQEAFIATLADVLPPIHADYGRYKVAYQFGHPQIWDMETRRVVSRREFTVRCHEKPTVVKKRK